MAIIFDFETLSVDRVNGVLLSMAVLEFEESRFNSKEQYSYTELLESSRYIKFDVESQVKKYGRQINQDTLKWWGEQSKSAQRQLKPTELDVDIDQAIPFINTHIKKKLDKVYTRGNTFDPIIIDYIAEQCKQDVPWPHWIVRDTRSMIEGMSWGIDLRNGFIPEGLESVFVAHDPQHDIVMDVMRLQTLALALG